ncbi:MAG: hypothetical protein B7Z58_16865, partial [Acidiphilium sp. 37-64-53]
DQVNLTDEESRIMPVAGNGFEQCYNAQAVVAAEVATTRRWWHSGAERGAACLYRKSHEKNRSGNRAAGIRSAPRPRCQTGAAWKG